MTRPTIIIVHGAFHQPEHFDTVATRLRNAGFDVALPRLPSVGMTTDPGGALHLDAAAVRDVIHETLTENGDDAVLVMHSYGGLVGTEGYGMFQEQASPHASATGSAQVRRLVYLAAHGAVEKGTTLLPPDVKPPPHLSMDDKGIITHVKSYERFYEGDCSEDKAQPPIDMCKPMAASAMTTATRYTAWKDYKTPVTFIKCLDDRAVTESMCDIYIARMMEAGVDITVETMDCGHSPAFVAPEELAELITKVSA